MKNCGAIFGGMILRDFSAALRQVSKALEMTGKWIPAPRLRGDRRRRNDREPRQGIAGAKYSGFRNCL